MPQGCRGQTHGNSMRRSPYLHPVPGASPLVRRQSSTGRRRGLAINLSMELGGGLVNLIALRENRRLGDGGRRDVSPLLRQPGGFEGGLLVLVQADTDNHPVMKRPDPSRPSLNLDPVAPDEVGGPWDDYVIARLDELVRFDADGFPVGVEAPKGAVGCFTPIKDTALRPTGARQVQYVIGRNVVQIPVPRLVEPLDSRLHSLDVLLRHRPRSISRLRGAPVGSRRQCFW